MSEEAENVMLRASEINFKSVNEARERILDELSAMFRWLIATLVTVNAGVGAIAFSSDKVEEIGKFIAGYSATIGICSAILLGYSQVMAAKALQAPISNLLEEWSKPLFGKSFDCQAICKAEGGLKSAIKPWSKLAHGLGWLSLLSFVVSTVAIGFHFK